MGGAQAPSPEDHGEEAWGRFGSDLLRSINAAHMAALTMFEVQNSLAQCPSVRYPIIGTAARERWPGSVARGYNDDYRRFCGVCRRCEGVVDASGKDSSSQDDSRKVERIERGGDAPLRVDVGRGALSTFRPADMVAGSHHAAGRLQARAERVRIAWPCL